jgi:hypothetical protein
VVLVGKSESGGTYLASPVTSFGTALLSPLANLGAIPATPPPHRRVRVESSLLPDHPIVLIMLIMLITEGGHHGETHHRSSYRTTARTLAA